VIAEPLNTKPKYVASTTLGEPLGWQNATLLQGDVADAVGPLKQEDGDDVHVIGSPQLVQTLTGARPGRRVPRHDRSASIGRRQATLPRRRRAQAAAPRR